MGKGAAESFVMGGISVTLDLLLMALNWESFWRTISSEEFKMGAVSVTPAETLGLKYILIALNQDFFGNYQIMIERLVMGGISVTLGHMSMAFDKVGGRSLGINIKKIVSERFMITPYISDQWSVATAGTL